CQMPTMWRGLPGSTAKLGSTPALSHTDPDCPMISLGLVKGVAPESCTVVSKQRLSRGSRRGRKAGKECFQAGRLALNRAIGGLSMLVLLGCDFKTCCRVWAQ